MSKNYKFEETNSVTNRKCLDSNRPKSVKLKFWWINVFKDNWNKQKQWNCVDNNLCEYMYNHVHIFSYCAFLSCTYCLIGREPFLKPQMVVLNVFVKFSHLFMRFAYYFGRIALAIPVYRLAMSVRLSTFWLSLRLRINLSTGKGYKLEGNQ